MKKWLVRYIDRNDKSSEIIINAETKQEAVQEVKRQKWCYRVIESDTREIK